MAGLSSTTGRPVDGIEHLRQSIRTILGTRVGLRVMRRTFGSDLPLLVDQPMTEAWKLDLFAATAEALAKWEPRFRLSRVELVEATSGGRATLSLSGLYYPRGHLGDFSDPQEISLRSEAGSLT